MNTYAYMIRRDGKVFNVDFHPYGTEGIEYVLDYLPWLFECTANESTRRDIAALIQAMMEYTQSSINDLFDGVDVPSQLLTYVNNYTTKTDKTNKELMDAVEYDLNQEFCRTRLGGRYNSDDVAAGEIVFRISSNNFNWFNVIWNFVYENRNKINSVTIVRDYESTGEETPYKEGRKVFFRMPVEDFITLSGNPIIESLFDDGGKQIG